MAAGALDVVVRFAADTSQLRAETAKVEGTGGKLKTWAKGVGAAIGGAFVVSQVKEWIGAASELQDQIGASEVTFGNAAKAVQNFSDTAAGAFGISKRAALEGANTFAAFGKGAGLQGKPLAKFSTDLVGLSGDLASFRGTSTEQALDAVGAALRGESEPIRAYGVMLDEATLKARAMSMGLVAASGDADKIKAAQISATSAQEKYNAAVKEHGKDSPEAAKASAQLELSQSKLAKATAGTVPELTAQQKVMAAQAEILAQTGDAQGDFARTSDSAANQQKALAAQMENTQAALGTALLPVLEAVLPVLQSFAKFVQENSSWLVPLTAAVLGVAAAVWIFNAALAANPIVLIAIGVGVLIAAIILLVKNWDKVTEAFRAAFDWVVENWPLLLAIITGPIGLAVKAVVDHWDTIKAAAAAVFNWVRDNWPLLLAIITGPIGIATKLVLDNWDRIKGAATALYDWVVGKLGGIVDFFAGVARTVGDLAGRIVDAIKRPLNAVIRGWNNLAIHVPEFDTHIPGVGKIGGGTVDFPNLPELARGGVVARTGLAVVHRGEAFSGVGNAIGNTYNVNLTVGPGVDPAQTGRTVVEYIAAFERANGKAWRS